jgi:CRP-like cAMP-binding protein
MMISIVTAGLSVYFLTFYLYGMQTSTEEILDSYLTNTLSDERLKAYSQQADSCLFHAYDVIYREGEEALSLYLLCQGKVTLLKRYRRKKHTIVETQQTGEMLGLVNIMGLENYSHTAIASNAVICLPLPMVQVRHCFATRPSLYIPLAKALSKKLLRYEHMLSH